MAKSKSITVKDIRAHLFIGIIGNHVELVYHDDYENGSGLGAALSSIMEEDDKLMGIVSAALLTALEAKEKKANWERVKFPKKEKDISKTAKKPVKKPTKVVNKK
jgi:hypothetical protein